MLFVNVILKAAAEGNGMTQKTRILEYLKTGKGITPLIAMDRFNCYRLSQRIIEIERDGYTIEHKWYPLRKGRCMSYRLIP